MDEACCFILSYSLCFVILLCGVFVDFVPDVDTAASVSWSMPGEWEDTWEAPQTGKEHWG